MSTTVGKQIGNFIGSFMDYDANNDVAVWREYMRIRVRIDVRLLLKKWKKIRTAGRDWSIVNFKYERLGVFCFICGVMGHTDGFCA